MVPHCPSLHETESRTKDSPEIEVKNSYLYLTVAMTDKNKGPKEQSAFIITEGTDYFFP